MVPRLSYHSVEYLTAHTELTALCLVFAGFGLSLTHMKLTSQHAGVEQAMSTAQGSTTSLTMTVSNVGKMTGDEVIMAYFLPVKVIKILIHLPNLHTTMKMSHCHCVGGCCDAPDQVVI